MFIKPLLHSSSFRQAATIAFICLLISSAAIPICDHVLSNIMKSHVRGMIFENLENKKLKGLFNNSRWLANQLSTDYQLDTRKDHFSFILDSQDQLIYGQQAILTQAQILILSDNRSNAPKILSLKSQHSELFGLLTPLADGGLYFNAYNIQPMLQQTRIIPLMTGAGLLAIQLSILLISLPFSLHNLFRVNHIIEVLEQYARGKHDVRVNYKNNGDEFGQLGKEINLVLSRTETLMGEVRTITSHVAHELRTPLTRLQHKLINLSEKTDEHELQELEEAIKETEQIQRLFRSIMRLSEVETGQVSHQKNKINAYDILHEAYEYYLPLAENLDIQLNIVANKKYHFYADKILIFQAIANLLDNALKYAPDSRVITLSLESSLGNTLIKVSDQGKGIAEEDQSVVTKRFKRLTSKQDVFGHGLGLTLVQAITTLHNGELTLINNHPGLTVCIALHSNEIN
ncbi:sensor histidine kinase [Marinomonas mediterranea]|uniref:histidine kinase n=1 Tax=Marinomonas mediterranea (strain ATCC 700492 / JCM 21426 / NBRC 103028 / MMB-1) TaxID=717774 RepID=F2K0V7_MARM1|nr:HAMP domain-containing sensor histidine kinase [Marinomonas mediterranea]ADZ93306.1 integral membrane sensor signal transduction histidine kinase [Marinomonas mediterranea MMB-1]WCN11196.1 GHKL domain-containing protein [Marinomonas mediterranea]WCN19304.1 GHKL domain-containing protein [Marinomonas mediterranea MMB-1]